MGTIGKVVLSLEADSAAFTRGTKESGKGLHDLGDSAKKAEKDLKGVKGALEALKESAGRGSTLDELGKTLRGAGAVAGITLIGESLNKVSEEALKLNKDFRDGKVDAAGIATELGKSLPIIGSFVSAGQNIREMFTHEQEQIDNINAEIKTGNQEWEDRVRIQEETKKSLDQIGEKIVKANQELALANAKPEDREQLEAKFKNNDAVADEKKELDEKTRLRREDLKKELDDIRAHGAELKKIMEDQAHNNLSLHSRISYAEGAERAREDAKRLADLQADILIQRAEKGAQERAKNDLAVEKQKLDEVVKLNDATQKQLSINKAGQEFWKGAEERAKSFLDGVAKFGEKLTKADEEARHQAVEKENQRLENLKHELDDLQKEKDQFGMTESQKKLDDMKRAGAGGDELKQAEKLQGQIDKMQEWKKEQEEANDLIKESMTPMDKYQQQIDKVQKLFKDGLITAQQQSDAIAKADADLKGTEKKPEREDDKPQKMAAQTRRFDFNVPADKGADVGRQQLGVAKQQVDLHKKTNDYLNDLWRFGNDANQNSDEVVDF